MKGGASTSAEAGGAEAATRELRRMISDVPKTGRLMKKRLNEVAAVVASLGEKIPFDVLTDVLKFLLKARNETATVLLIAGPCAASLVNYVWSTDGRAASGKRSSAVAVTTARRLAAVAAIACASPVACAEPDARFLLRGIVESLYVVFIDLVESADSPGAADLMSDLTAICVSLLKSALHGRGPAAASAADEGLGCTAVEALSSIRTLAVIRDRHLAPLPTLDPDGTCQANEDADRALGALDAFAALPAEARRAHWRFPGTLAALLMIEWRCRPMPFEWMRRLAEVNREWLKRASRTRGGVESYVLDVYLTAVARFAGRNTINSRGPSSSHAGHADPRVCKVMIADAMLCLEGHVRASRRRQAAGEARALARALAGRPGPKGPGLDCGRSRRLASASAARCLFEFFSLLGSACRLDERLADAGDARSADHLLHVRMHACARTLFKVAIAQRGSRGASGAYDAHARTFARSGYLCCSNAACTDVSGPSDPGTPTRACGCGCGARFCSRRCQVEDWRRGHRAECAAGTGSSSSSSSSSSSTAVLEISVVCEAMATLLGVKVPEVLLSADFQVHFHHVSAFHHMRKRLPMLNRIVTASAEMGPEGQ